MTDATPAYQVLARKYRPQTFADLIGQEAMVRTLKNAFAADRIAQARGVDPGLVRALLQSHVEGRTFGVLGQPRVNVLMTNLALDARFPPPTR